MVGRNTTLASVIQGVRRQIRLSGMRRWLYLAVALILMFMMFRWMTRDDKTYNDGMGYRGELESVMTRPAVAQPKEMEKNTVTLEVYMESQCPDTTRFMHKQMMTAWEKLGATGRVDLTIVPFGKARCVEKGQDFECQCQHGPTECVLNQLMNCVIDRIGFPDKYLPVVNCIQGQRGLDGAMSACIAGHSILNEKQTRECAEGVRGRRLLAMAGARTAGLSPALTFVPWITLNGVREADALYDLTENLCKKMQPAPEQCAGYKL